MCMVAIGRVGVEAGKGPNEGKFELILRKPTSDRVSKFLERKGSKVGVATAVG